LGGGCGLDELSCGCGGLVCVWVLGVLIFGVFVCVWGVCVCVCV